MAGVAQGIGVKLLVLLACLQEVQGGRGILQNVDWGDGWVPPLQGVTIPFPLWIKL